LAQPTGLSRSLPHVLHLRKSTISPWYRSDISFSCERRVAQQEKLGKRRVSHPSKHNVSRCMAPVSGVSGCSVCLGVSCVWVFRVSGCSMCLGVPCVWVFRVSGCSMCLVVSCTGLLKLQHKTVFLRVKAAGRQMCRPSNKGGLPGAGTLAAGASVSH